MADFTWRHGTAATEAAGSLLAGRYVVEEPISKGSMGAVYRGHDTQAGRPVAIKRLIDLTQVARFEIEARLLSQLQHPRVVRVLDHFGEGDGAYIVMNLVEGRDLAAVLAGEGCPGLPAERVLEWTHQVCEALDYVHRQRVVHRDIKPQNLILGETGVVVVDFGVARDLSEEGGGTVGVGTPRYMAPEIFAGGTVSERSDVFSLATTVWTLLAGAPPEYGDSTPLSAVCRDAQPGVEQALRAGMEFLPERRIGSVEAFARALGRPVHRRQGSSLGNVNPEIAAPPSLMGEILRTAAGTFNAAAASIALCDTSTGELVFQAAWGAGAREIVGVRLPRNTGINGRVVATGEPIVVAECRKDPRFQAQIAAGTGYVPHTMLVVPLLRRGETIGSLSVLDRRDGGSYAPGDESGAKLFADLVVAALEVVPSEKAFAPIPERAG